MEDDSAQRTLNNILADPSFPNYFTWDVSAVPGLVAITVLAMLSALVSASEVAFFSLSPSQLSELDLKHGRSQRIKHFLGQPEKLLGTILVSNNLFNVAFIIVSHFVIIDLFNFRDNIVLETVFNVIIITSVLVLFGELLPKTYASRHNLAVAYRTVNLLKVLYTVTSPVVNLLNLSSEIVYRGLSRKESQMTDADIDQAIEMTVGNGTSEGNTQILKGIVKFGNTSVKQIMQPRLDVVAIDRSIDFQALLQIIRDSGYSRIPVYEGDFDNIIGLLYAKDLLAHLEQSPDFNWQKLLRKALYVPESKKIDDLLEEFRGKRVHMAVVVDEYGGASGIVTLEDVLEEVIGEIKDEFDDAAEDIQFKKIDDRSFIFHGKTQLNDVCRVVGIPTSTFDSVKGDADTLAGLILEITGSMPKSGEDIQFDKYTFKIISVNNIRIVRVQFTIHDNVEAAA